MLRFLILTALLLAAPLALRAEVHLFPAPQGGSTAEMVIYSSLDLPLAGPLIEGFQQAEPGIAVRYELLLTGEITDRILLETDSGGPTADFAFSSAMDQQMKLANDGYARAVVSADTPGWPRWANWRNMAYALTFEPAVMAYYRPAFADEPPPSTRFELMAWLRRQPGGAPAVIGTYDIGQSALGYLFLARDYEHFDRVWSLVSEMERAGMARFSTSHEVLTEIAAGRLKLGYNLLGSYAADWARSHPQLGLILPRDFVVVVSRVGLVPEAAGRPELGAKFLAWLMSPAGQTVLASRLRLPAVSLEVTDETSARAMQQALGDQLKPVPVSPGLLVYLDQAKRQQLMRRWHRALADAQDLPGSR